MQPGFESSCAPLSKGLIHDQPCSSRTRRSANAQHQLNDNLNFFPTNELQALIMTIQTESMEQVLQSHVRSLLLLIDEKEAMLQSVTNTNLQLQNRVAQFMQQSQAWKDVAKKNETMVWHLRSKLEEVIEQKRAKEASYTNENDAESSSSDNYYGTSQTRHANNAILYSSDSNKNDITKQQQVGCRVCGKRDVSVLLLPCRHLCLCKICEVHTHFCPICKSLKKASLQV